MRNFGGTMRAAAANSAVAPALSAVVPAKAGTHKHRPRCLLKAVPLRLAAAYGSPPSRGRQPWIAAANAGLFALFTLLAAPPATAQSYPNRPITLVVPYAA